MKYLLWGFFQELARWETTWQGVSVKRRSDKKVESCQLLTLAQKGRLPLLPPGDGCRDELFSLPLAWLVVIQLLHWSPNSSVLLLIRAQVGAFPNKKESTLPPTTITEFEIFGLTVCLVKNASNWSRREVAWPRNWSPPTTRHLLMRSSKKWQLSVQLFASKCLSWQSINNFEILIGILHHCRSLNSQPDIDGGRNTLDYRNQLLVNKVYLRAFLWNKRCLLAYQYVTNLLCLSIC